MLNNVFHPSRWPLSYKFLLIILLILLIPVASVGVLKEIEKTLENDLKKNLVLSTKLISHQLELNKSWFEESLLPNNRNLISKELFVFSLGQSFNLDGYFDDWNSYIIHQKHFENNNSSMAILLGHHKKHLILSVKIKDQFVIFPSSKKEANFDLLEVEVELRSGKIKKLKLYTNSSGKFSVRTKKGSQYIIDWRYKAVWQTTATGFNIELQFPSGLKPVSIKVSHKNVDQKDGEYFINTNASSYYENNLLVWPSEKIVDFFKHVELSSAQRIWLLDNQGRVLSSTGNLESFIANDNSIPLLDWILNEQSKIVFDVRKNSLYLASDDISLALQGEPTSRIENAVNSEQSIAMATYPIKIDNKIYGVILLEENIARVQVLQKKTLLNMFAIIFVVFILIIWLIFWYVAKLVNRIKKLSTSIEQVVDSSGRMSAPLSLDGDVDSYDFEKGDELDELYKAFSHMGNRLFEYNDHLEKLASRLSHELRTPMAIVRSSLDNLLLGCQSEDDKEIINRALQGNQRLGEILSRMRQASGVKDAMQTAEKEMVDMGVFLQQITNGYQSSFSEYQFIFETNVEQKQQEISVELFAEMMDKLISNAMEFSQINSLILINFKQKKNAYFLSVSNSGPLIQKKYLKRIFHSLVSVRTSEQASGKNLGLGLYIVRLIADFHSASVKAINRQDGTGVIFLIKWRLAS